MFIKLTRQERLQLTSRHRACKHPAERDRIKVVLAYDQGYSYTEMARILLLDDSTIKRHFEDSWNDGKLLYGGQLIKLKHGEDKRHHKSLVYREARLTLDHSKGIIPPVFAATMKDVDTVGHHIHHCITQFHSWNTFFFDPCVDHLDH